MPGRACGAGFRNPSAFVTPDAPDTYAFADGVHPSTAAHKLLSEFAISVLEAPRQIAVLPHSAAMVGRARADMIGLQVLARPEGDDARWWGDIRGDYQRYKHDSNGGDDFDGGGPTFSAGVDWRSGDVVYGAFGGYGVQRSDWGTARRFDHRDATLGGYLAGQRPPLDQWPTELYPA